MTTDSWLSPEVATQLARLSLLRPLLKQQVLAGMALEQSLEDSERQQSFAQLCRERGLESAEALRGFLQANLLEEQDLRALAEQPLRLQKAIEQRFMAKAEARFLSRKSQLDRAVYSLLRLSDQNLARELYLRIEEGEAAFADLAVEFSEGPEQRTRGIVGPAPLSHAHPLLAERLRTATIGVALEPFKIESWWLVVRLESLSPASLDESTRRQMAAELLEVWSEEEVERLMVQLVRSGGTALEMPLVSR